MLAGKWTYRSFRNDPKLIAGDPAAALALILDEGVFDLDADGATGFRGALGTGTGYALALAGELVGSQAHPGRFFITGDGLDGTATEGWRYAFRGFVGPQWPDAVGQVASLLGTVIRIAGHGPDAPAGVTASFIAVRQQEGDRPRPARRPVLMAGS